MNASYYKYVLNFKRPSGTSRGVMNEKETWFIIIKENGKIGIGECGILRGLSADDTPEYEQKLKWTCQNIDLGVNALWQELIQYPSIQFGVEMAFKSLKSKDLFDLYPSNFTVNQSTIPINGLIWMGDEGFMKSQIQEKLNEGFKCVKLKIGAIDFEKEIALLKYIRKNFDAKQIEIRVDANGAFSPETATEKLNILSQFDIHSIEQPIQKGNHTKLSELCNNTPIPIALDEELIGIFNFSDKENLLKKVRPQYIILKPSFIGGFKGTDEWINIAENLGINWWITSALESNIGLNAIAQYTFIKNNKLPQGLGTGALYTNNFNSPLVVQNGHLSYNNALQWDLNSILSLIQS